MSQVITNAFEQYWQSSLAAEQPVVLDEFILADIPNLDITAPIDPDTVLPPESQIVHRQNVDQRGRVNNNAVAYTIVMDTTIGDFSFNAMYLRNKQNGVIGMIVYKGRETKLKTDQTTGQTGNSLVKSMLMGYDQAAEATLTHVDAGTWQIDYAARLRGMDEDIRQLQADLYGHHTFVGDGFKVVEQDGAYQVTQGVAIVGGLRVELKQPELIYPGTKPIGVWVDVHRAGSLLSEYQNHFTIITSVADLTDHVDSNGYQHYVAKLATVMDDGTIEDGQSNDGITVDVGTYAAIREYSGAATKLNCLGRENMFDRAFGMFMLDSADTTSADNDCTIIVDELGRRWKRQFDGGISVAWAGAKGVGTDDSAAIIAANNIAVAGKMKLRFPQGNYNFSSNYEFATKTHHYWEGEQSTITFTGNGRMFSVNCNWTRAMHVKSMNFTVSSPTVNNNVTGFYLHHGTQFGACFKFEDCDFDVMTNCSIHAIRAFKFNANNCKFYGASAYSYSSGMLNKYNDAGIRLWGADGTETLQDHSFSNVGHLEGCFFGRCKFGIDGWSVITTRVISCTFEPCYIGIINRKVNNVGGYNSSTDRGGFNVGQIHLDSCWFEQIASYYICGADIDPNTGYEEPGQSLAAFQGTGENYTTNVRVHPRTLIVTISHRLTGFRNNPDTSLDNILISAFTNGPDITYAQFGTKSALVDPTLTLNNGVKMGEGSTILSRYETGTFKPKLYLGENDQAIASAGVDGVYTRIGNIVHFSCSLFTTAYSKIGIGNLQLRNLPFANKANSGLLGAASVTSFNQLTGTSSVFGEMISGTANMKFSKPDFNFVTDADLNGSSSLNLRVSGYYFV